VFCILRFFLFLLDTRKGRRKKMTEVTKGRRGKKNDESDVHLPQR
jgi:hypothetical protein